MSKKELLEKISKMKEGLSNPSITDEVKETLKIAISNAEKQLKELEEKEKPSKSKSLTNYKKYLSLIKKETSLQKQLKTVSSGEKYNAGKKSELESQINAVARQQYFYYSKFNEAEIEAYEKEFMVPYEAPEEQEIPDPKFKVNDEIEIISKRDLKGFENAKIIEILDYSQSKGHIYKVEDQKTKNTSIHSENDLKIKSKIEKTETKTDKPKNLSSLKAYLKNNINKTLYLRIWRSDNSGKKQLVTSEARKIKVVQTNSFASENETKPTLSWMDFGSSKNWEFNDAYFEFKDEYVTLQYFYELNESIKREFTMLLLQKPEKSLTDKFIEIFLKKELTGLSKIVSDFKKTLMDDDIYLGDTLRGSNLFISLRAEKLLNLFCKQNSLEKEKILQLMRLDFSFLSNPEEAKIIEKNLVNLVVSNFVSKSQFAAMQSKELDSVKRDMYIRLMEMPVIGFEGDTSKFQLHYFNSGSDFYISEIDYGSNMQDYGYAILNGDLQNAEYGYISIEEMITSKNPVELDLYFEPINKKELIEKLQEKDKPKSNEEETKNTKKGLGVFEPRYYDFLQTLKNIPDNEILTKYREFEQKNYHIENVVLMALKVGNKQQLDRAKEIYIEFLEHKSVDSTLSEKSTKLYYELHDDFRNKYLKVDEPSISENKINELVSKTIAQLFLEYGNNTEIKSIEEVVSDNQIDVHFEAIREIDAMRDHTSKIEIHIDFNGEILDEFTFPIPDKFDVEKFLIGLLDNFDNRTKNQIYPFSKFLAENSEKLIGKKVGSKSVKNLAPEEREKLMTEYKSKSKTSEKTSSGKLKLTKRLIAHGVTQQMIDEVNRTKEGVVIRAGKQAKQTGSSKTKIDKQISAMLPGKRLSASGKIYYEYRKNRSDKNPNNKL
jgi:hypothetical protein